MKLNTVALWVSLTFLLIKLNSAKTTTTEASPKMEAPRRIIAMGDLHGDLQNTKKILHLAGLIDDNAHWSGGDAVYVQTGDVLDRGTDTIELYKLIQQLRKEAPEHGGLVIPLLGNHEIMNLGGDWRYVSQAEMATFGGHDKRVKAFKSDGFIGEYLIQLNMTTKVGGTVFCHGGISPDFARMGVDQINEYTHHDLLDYMASGGRADPHKIFGGHSPIWYRGYALDDEPDICAVANKALAYMNADRMVMGHTVQRDGVIRTRCDGKIILIDIGISWVYGGFVGALEIIGDQVVAIYEHGRVTLPPKQTHHLDFLHQEL